MVMGMKKRGYLVVFGVFLLLGGVAAYTFLISAPQTAEEFLDSGRAYFGERRYPEATVQFMNARQREPDNREARFLLAQSYLAQQLYNEAARELQGLLESYPDDFEANLQLASIYIRGGSGDSRFFDEARDIAGRLLAADPQSVPALILMGHALAGLQDYRSAAETFEEVLSLDPENAAALVSLGSSEAMQDNFAQAEQAYLRAREADPGNKDALMALAVFYRARSQNDRAEAMFREALSIDPSDRAVYVQLASLYLATDRFDRASEVLGDAQESDPDDPAPSLMLAALYRSEHRTADAVRLLLDLKERFPANANVAASVAQALMLEDPARARREIDQILELDPTGPTGHVLLGTWLFAEGRYDEAGAALSRDIVLDRPSPAAHYFRGRLAEISGEPDRASIEYRSAVNLNPSYLPARLALAELLIREGRRLGEARGEVARVLDMDPRSVSGRLALGALDTAERRYAEAQATFAELLGDAPDNALVHLRMGLNYEASGSAAQAGESLRRALELEPGSDEILAQLARFYADQGQIDRAVQAITDAAPDSQRPAIHHHLMGLAYVRGGRLNEAEAAFRSAIEAEPGQTDSMGFLARMYLQAGRLDEALEQSDALLERRPRDPEALTTRGVILENRGDTAAARDSYARALEIAPGSFRAANNLAYLLEKEGNLPEALTWAQIARRAAPQNPNVADTLGWIQHRLGSQILARQQLEFAVSVEPGNPVFLYHLAMVYRETDQIAQAENALGRALAGTRDFAERGLAEALLEEIRQRTDSRPAGSPSSGSAGRYALAAGG